MYHVNYETLIAFSAATFALAISPGPDNIFVLVQSMTNGKKFGLATVAGLMTGCLVHTTLLAFGVSAVIKDNASIFNLIKIFGALYLLFLAASVYRGGNTISLDSDEKQEKSLAALYRQGFIMNVLNPKVTIFFLAFFPGFLFSDSMNTIVQFYVLGLLFIFVSTLVFGGIALLSGTIAGFLNDNVRTGSILKWLQIIVFVGIAVFLVFG